MKLPDNTTDRLLAVASIIENQPEHWRQGDWDGDFVSPRESQGVTECGTACCIAGWAVRLTPRSTNLTDPNWFGAGAWAKGATKALGLGDEHLTYKLFYTGGENLPYLPDVLRVIASFPEGERTYANVHAACVDKGIEF